MNTTTTQKREVPEFSLEQKAYLESFFEILNLNLENVQSILKLTNESLIDSHGELNEKINIWDIHRTLTLINDTIDPINTELCELSSGANYLLWDSGKKNRFQFWDKVEDLYPLALESVKKREVYKVEFRTLNSPYTESA